MTNLEIIDLRGKRVLTTAQLAESYGADNKQISYNFNYNKERYTKGKHYISLSGEEKRDFINRHEIQDGSINAQIIYLWTEKGAWLHAKSLNTDEAWDAYEMLVDDYYSIKEKLPMNQDELILMLAQQNVDSRKEMELMRSRQLALESNITAQNDSINQMRDVVTMIPENLRKDTNSIVNSVSHNSGKTYQEVRNEVYNVLEIKGKCNLNTRVNNKKKRLLSEVKSESTVNKVNKVDVIMDDPKLSEIYLSILKDYAIKYSVVI